MTQHINFIDLPGSLFFAEDTTFDVTISAVDEQGNAVSRTIQYTSAPATTTTTTTTTTDSPEDVLIDRTNLSDCDCGIVKLPKGRRFAGASNPTVRALVKDENTSHHVDLLHHEDVLLRRDQKFSTVTEYIDQSLTPKNIVIYLDIQDGDTSEEAREFYRLIIENVIRITVRDFKNQTVIASKTIGQYEAKTKIRRHEILDKPCVVLESNSDIDLLDNALIIDIESVCQYSHEPCCDSLPVSIQLFGDGVICLPLDENYPTTTTTTMPPDSLTFDELLTATLEDEVVSLSATISSTYDTDIQYYVEVTDGSCQERVSDLLTVKSGEQLSFSIKKYGTDLNFRLLIISPTYVYSNTATITNTTTTTLDPLEEKGTTYTTAPPLAPATNFIITDGTRDASTDAWTISYTPSSEYEQMTEFSIEYRERDLSTQAFSPWKKYVVMSKSEYVSYYGSDLEIDATLTLTFSKTNGIGGDTSYISTDAPTVAVCNLYEFRIGYKNDRQYNYSATQGWSVQSLPSIPRTLSSAKNSSDATQLDVNWSSPAEGDCGDIIYGVEYRHDGESLYTKHDWDGVGTSVSIPSLDASKEYYVKVYATNTRGLGPSASNNPYTELLLHFNEAYYGQNIGVYTPDASSYSRITKIFGCGTGYVNEPSSQYFGSSNLSCVDTSDYKFGTACADPQLTTCPVMSDNFVDDETHTAPRVCYEFNDMYSYNDNIILHDNIKSNFTLEYWLKVPTIAQSSVGKVPFISMHGNNPSEYGDALFTAFDIDFVSNTQADIYLNYSDETIRFDDQGNPRNISLLTDLDDTNVCSITDNDWHHIALVIDGELNNATDAGFIKLYLDGTEEYSAAMVYRDFVTETAWNDIYFDPLWIVNILDIHGSNYFAGGGAGGINESLVACVKIDEFRLSSASIYCSNFTPPTVQLDQANQEPC
tara:strand:+ start:2062 stop:4851 length:2790 start_codon:yes stop_codon:yes gene_type:complete